MTQKEKKKVCAYYGRRYHEILNVLKVVCKVLY